MKFNERLKSIREEKCLTQQQLSDRSGVSVRTIQNYESGSYSPRFGIVDKLAEALEVSSPELLGQSGMLVAEAAVKYGARGAMQAKQLTEEVTGLFAGGDMAEEDMDLMMKAIQDAYWIAKQNNKKFTPKKHRSE